MSKIGPPAPNPCGSCPYRRDVPSGVWSAEEYAKLRMYDRETGAQPLGLFQCHQNGSDSDRARVCAGWVGCHGEKLLALRIAVSMGRVDPEVMNYTTPVKLFASGAQAAAHGIRRIRRPGRRARELIAKVSRVRPDVLDGGV